VESASRASASLFCEMDNESWGFKRTRTPPGDTGQPEGAGGNKTSFYSVSRKILLSLRVEKTKQQIKPAFWRTSGTTNQR